MDPVFEELKTDILSSRQYGRTTVALADRVHYSSNPAAEADAFVCSLGFQGISGAWQLVSPSDARTILERVLARDLAYNGPVMADSSASKLSDRFLALFDVDVLCLTNGTYHIPSVQSSKQVRVGPTWNPISESTFDTGVVCVDNSRIGILWVEDED
jgi:hypothetical protein